METAANVLPRPLTGIVFHYDTFISDNGGSPCEVAWLSSNTAVNVRVLCPPTNIGTIKVSSQTQGMADLTLLANLLSQKLYSRFPNVRVEELRLNQTDLNTRRMLDLMVVKSGPMPLYLHVASRILREMRIKQQHDGSGFDYGLFKQMLLAETLTAEQVAPLKQRLDNLESFLIESQKGPAHNTKKVSGAASTQAPSTQYSAAPQIATDWAPKVWCHLV